MFLYYKVLFPYSKKQPYENMYYLSNDFNFSLYNVFRVLNYSNSYKNDLLLINYRLFVWNTNDCETLMRILENIKDNF